MVYHSLIKKTRKEIYEILQEKKKKEKDKKERQKIQDENVIKKQEKIEQNKQQQQEENKNFLKNNNKTFKEDENVDFSKNEIKNKTFLGKKKFRDDEGFKNKNMTHKKKKKNKFINPEKETIMTKRSLKQFNKLKKHK